MEFTFYKNLKLSVRSWGQDKVQTNGYTPTTQYHDKNHNTEVNNVKAQTCQRFCCLYSLGF